MMSEHSARLDVELVHRGLARSRRRAAELVSAGRVAVDGRPARKPSQPVGPSDELAVAPQPGVEYVSRAAHKLEGAFAALEGLGAPVPRVAAAHCLDVGASTGGFTQVLLERGARHVVALDVGHGQLDPLIAADPRVTSIEGVNARDLSGADLPGPAPDLVVADLSFISLRLVLPALLGAAAPSAELLVMVKPQFEIGRERLASTGVVTDPGLRVEAVLGVVGCVSGDGPHGATARVRALVPSALPGEHGNREYFVWLTAGPTGAGLAPDHARVPAAVREAVEADRAVVLEEVR